MILQSALCSGQAATWHLRLQKCDHWHFWHCVMVREMVPQCSQQQWLCMYEVLYSKAKLTLIAPGADKHGSMKQACSQHACNLHCTAHLLHLEPAALLFRHHTN